MKEGANAIASLYPCYAFLTSGVAWQIDTARSVSLTSAIRLTMGVYTDPELLNQRAALETLPRLDLSAPRPEAGPTSSETPVTSATEPEDTPTTLNEAWQDFLAFFLPLNSAEQGTSVSMPLTSTDIGDTRYTKTASSVKTAGAITYDRSRHLLAASAAAYPQGDSNP